MVNRAKLFFLRNFGFVFKVKFKQLTNNSVKVSIALNSSTQLFFAGMKNLFTNFVCILLDHYSQFSFVNFNSLHSPRRMTLRSEY